MASCIIADRQSQHTYRAEIQSFSSIRVEENENWLTNSFDLKRNSISAETRSSNEKETEHICRSQSGAEYENQSSPVKQSRPDSLLDSSEFRPKFRSYKSYPSQGLHCCMNIDEDSELFSQFNSIHEEKKTTIKRFRSQTFTNFSIPLTIEPALPRSTVFLMNCSQIARRIQSDQSRLIFDCGSILRQSQHRIRDATLLNVSDKISRRCLKNNKNKESILKTKQMHQSSFIIVYDDQISLSDQSEVQIDLSEKNNQVPLGIRFFCEEIQQSLPDDYPSILILNCAFNNFFELYPNLCESLQVHSTPASPVANFEDPTTIRTIIPPHTAPILSHLDSNEDLSTYSMTHIAHGIYIGSELDAKDLDKLRSENIEYIVNVTAHVPLHHHDKLHYCHLPADDTSRQNLIDYFVPAYNFIEEAINKRAKVLVHCVAGISRSPAIVISFLMRYAHMSLTDAYDLVKRKRSIVAPNLNFMGQLSQYEKILRDNH